MLNKLRNHCWLLLLFTSCRQTPADYVHFVNDTSNGLTLERNVGKFFYKAQLLPADYQILLAHRGNTAISEAERDSLRALYNAYYYLRFEVRTSTDPGISATTLQYNAVKNFVLVSGQDSLVAAICQPVASGKQHTFEYMLAFPRTESKGGALELVYNDPDRGSPVQHFRFKHENLDVTLF